MQHEIRRIILDITVPDQAERFSIPGEWQERFNTQYLPQLEDALNKLAPGAMLHIDKLVLDIGNTTETDMPAKFMMLLNEQLQEAWQEAIINSATAAHDPSPVNINKTTINTALNNPTTALQLLCYFLTTGLLPWYVHTSEPYQKDQATRLSSRKQVTVDARNAAQLKQEEAQPVQVASPDQLVEIFLQTQPGNQERSILQSLLQQEEIRHRFLIAFSDTAQLSFLLFMKNTKAEHDRIFIQQMLLLGRKLEWAAPAGQFAKAFFTFLLSKTNPSIALPDFFALPVVDNLAQQMAVTAAGKATLVAAMRRLAKEVNKPTQQAINNFVRSLQQKATTQAPHSSSEAVAPAHAFVHNNIDEQEISHNKPMPSADRHLTDLLQQAIDDGLPVFNAGIVLLHPFLPRFFSVLKLLDAKGQFENETAQHKAAQILHYLLTGNSLTPEYELMLNKILCGIAPETPVAGKLRLTPLIKKECKDLLAAFTEQWQQVSQSSTAGIVAAFLKRPGILKQQNEGWLIQVEQQAYDILLERVPWGISYIQFRWNIYPLFTEWF